jgi:hypothetical protein
MKHTSDQTTNMHRSRRAQRTRSGRRALVWTPRIGWSFSVGAASVCLAVCLAVMASPATADITTGLVAYYPLNGDGQDASGYGRHGTPNNVVPTNDRFGTPNGACFFSGDAYYVAAADGLPTGERSVALWLRPDDIFVSQGVMPIGYGGGVCGTSWIEAVYEQSVVRASHCNEQGMVHPYEMEVGTWHHWVVTTSPQGSRMYVDGEPAGSWEFFVNNTDTGTRHLGIGAGPSPAGYVPYSDANVRNFIGAIDEVRIYNRALTSDDVAELYTPGTNSVDARSNLALLESVGPNPSASGCDIRFSIAGPASVGFAVFDAGGRIVAEVPGREFPAGSHLVSWDGRDSGGQGVPVGTYFLRLLGAGDGQAERLVVIR